MYVHKYIEIEEKEREKDYSWLRLFSILFPFSFQVKDVSLDRE